jgi:acetyl-CoA C-acetyltransferase
MSATDLGKVAVEGAMSRAGIAGEHVDEVILGNVVSAGLGQAPARQVALGSGLPLSVPCTTINKVCASGMKSVMFAAQSIMTGQNDVVVAGGFESMSNVPYYVPGGRFGMKYGHGKIEDGLMKDGLWDVYNDFAMGNCGDVCAKEYGFTREEQDAFAVESYKRVAAAWEAGKFSDEVVPVPVPQRRGDAKMMEVDEEFTRINYDRIPTLRPAFNKDGTITAANASTLNDGAAALVVTTADKAAELGVTPIARVRGFGDAAHEPVNFTTAPAKAVPKALAMAGVDAKDIEYHEINEAFAVVAMVNMRLMDLDHSRVNVNGGATAMGHPIGMSGARILMTLLSVLKQNDATLGCASICNGGGGASAVVLERL